MAARSAWLILLAALAAAPAVPALGAPQARYLAGPSDAHRTACNHYQNRARFKPRAGTIEFVTLMAEACAGAMASLGRPEPRLHAAAAAFLDRLVDLNAVVREMNAERVFGAANRRPDLRADGSGREVRLPRVTDTGEFLIAHCMGLFVAMDDWIDEGGGISLALR